MNLEYSESKKWLTRSLQLSVGFYLVTAVAAFSSGRAASGLAMLAFLIQVCTLLCRRVSNSHYRLGESVRRPAMLQDGLGMKPSALLIARIAARLGVPSEGSRLSMDRYYASSSPPSPLRLVQNTEESAFWTAELSKKAASFIVRSFGVAAVLMILVVYLAIQIGVGNQYSDAFAKAFLATLTFWMSSDLLMLAWRYTSLAEAADNVLSDSEVFFSHQEKADRDAIVIMDGYNCALAAAPVIPEFIYGRNRDRLNDAWSIRHHDGATPAA